MQIEEQQPMHEKQTVIPRERHEIGDSMGRAFKNIVYQSYNELVLTENNQTFCTINVKNNDDEQIKNFNLSEPPEINLQF